MSDLKLFNHYQLEPMSTKHIGALTPIFRDEANLQNIAHKNIDVESLCQSAERHWQNYGFGLYAIMDTAENNKIIGRGGTRLWMEDNDEYGNLEYVAFIDNAHQGKGIGTELAKLSLKQAFTEPHIDAFIVQAMVTPDNNPSQQMLTKAGMQKAELAIQQNAHDYLLYYYGSAMYTANL